MNPTHGHRLRVASLVLALAVCECRAVQPEVGAFRGACVGDSPYGTPEGGASGKNDPRCLPSSGTAEDECGICENANCCAARFGCYDELGCNCADQAFDACLERAEVDGSDATQAATRCWSAFAASGAKATARVACQRAACQSACEVPDF